MPRYHSHSLQLTDAQEKDFQEVNKRTGFGVKKIFMAMIEAMKETKDPIIDAPVLIEEEV